MAIKIAYLLLALGATCSCLNSGSVGAADPSGTDPGFALGLKSPSRDVPVPKIEPLALTRPGFNPIRAGPRRYDPDPGRSRPGNLSKGRFGIRVRIGPGGYIRRNLPSVGIRRPVIPRPGIPGSLTDVPRYPIDIRPGGYLPGNLPPGGIRRPVIPNPGIPGSLPDVPRYPIDIRPGGYLPGNLPSGGINHPWPGGYVPGHLPPGRFPLNPGWNQGGHDPFRAPGMNKGPFSNGPRLLPIQGGNFASGLPSRHPILSRPDFNEVNHTSKDNNDKGTVVVTVVAVNNTDKGSVHTNVTITVVPTEGENKETLKWDTKQHLNTAQSIVDEILNKHKDEEQKSKKTSNNLEDVLNKLVLPKV